MILSEKVELAKQCIINAYEKNNGNIFIFFSGGKDSTILRHIALSIYPDLKIVFSNTTNEIYDVIQYVKSFDNIIWVKPKLNFQQVVEKHGFPLISKEVSQKVYELKHTNGLITLNTRLNGDKKGNGVLSKIWRVLAEQEFDITHKCCKILKKDPLEKWAKENNMKPVIALMKDESMLRKQLALYGDDNDKKIYPFLNTGWTEQDIWDYATIHNIRFAECYYDRVINGHFIPARKRTGCEYCGFGIHLEDNDRFITSSILTPKRYDKIMKLKNNGISFKTAIKISKNQKILKNKPVLDIYGIKIKKAAISLHKKYSFFDLESTIKTSSCSCGSKDISLDSKFDMNFFDSPDDNGNLRNIWTTVSFYKCNKCSNKFYGNMHMFNMKYRVTNRLIDFIRNNLNNMSMQDMMLVTNLSYERLFLILLSFDEVKSKFSKESFDYYFSLFSSELDSQVI